MRNEAECHLLSNDHATGWVVKLLSFLVITGQLSGCALMYRDLEPPTAELVAIQPVGLQNDLSLTVLTSLRISNSNSVDLPVEGGQLEISLNGKEVATSNLTKEFSVPANGSTDIALPIDINLAAGLAIGLDVLNNQSADLTWQLAGHVDVGLRYLGRVPVRESGVIQMGAGSSRN